MTSVKLQLTQRLRPTQSSNCTHPHVLLFQHCASTLNTTQTISSVSPMSTSKYDERYTAPSEEFTTILDRSGTMQSSLTNKQRPPEYAEICAYNEVPNGEKRQILPSLGMLLAASTQKDQPTNQKSSTPDTTPSVAIRDNNSNSFNHPKKSPKPQKNGSSVILKKTPQKKKSSMTSKTTASITIRQNKNETSGLSNGLPNHHVARPHYMQALKKSPNAQKNGSSVMPKTAPQKNKSSFTAKITPSIAVRDNKSNTSWRYEGPSYHRFRKGRVRMSVLPPPYGGRLYYTHPNNILKK
jgi:hypothetical protein